MRYRKVANAFYWAAVAGNVVSGFAVLILSGIRQADISAFSVKWQLSVPISDLLVSVKDNAWWSLPFFAILTGALSWLLKRIGSPWLWGVVHVVLDELRRKAFNVRDTDPLHYHRVTLFKRVRWLWCCKLWPWSGWLVAVERSGHTTLSGVTYFRAPDDADKAEGVAGRIWSSDGTIKVVDLPAITARSSDDDVQKYSTTAFVSEADVRQRLPQARSLGGCPIEVKGKRWGVLVLDSRAPNALTELGEAMFTPMGKTLSKLLEKL